MTNFIYGILAAVAIIIGMGYMQTDDEQHREVDRQAVRDLPSRYNYAKHVDRDAFDQLVQQGNSLGYVSYASTK